MEIIQVDDEGRLFLSSAIDDWPAIHERGINVVFDLEEGLDLGVPTVPGGIIYLYYHFADTDLPDMRKLAAVAELGAALCREGSRVLVHCTMGFNRSALLTGKILCRLGWDGPAAVARLQERRPGALYNEAFHRYLMSRD